MSNDQLAVILGNNIVTQRKRLGIGQSELAQKLDITANAMMRIEKGMIAPKMSRISNIAKHLNCSVSYLFQTEEEFTSERAKIIEGLLDQVSPQGQEAIIDLIANTIKVMKIKE